GERLDGCFSVRGGTPGESGNEAPGHCRIGATHHVSPYWYESADEAGLPSAASDLAVGPYLLRYMIGSLVEQSPGVKHFAGKSSRLPPRATKHAVDAPRTTP